MWKYRLVRPRYGKSIWLLPMAQSLTLSLRDSVTSVTQTLKLKRSQYQKQHQEKQTNILVAYLRKVMVKSSEISQSMLWRSTGKRRCPPMEACILFSTFIVHPCRVASLTMLLLRKRIKKKRKRKKKRLRRKKVDRERRAVELYRPERCPYSEVKLESLSPYHITHDVFVVPI